MHIHQNKLGISILIIVLFLSLPFNLKAQAETGKSEWIRPNDKKSPAKWGIKDGIVFSLWPTSVGMVKGSVGGPRGLLRIGHNFEGETYLINFIAVEPVVDGEMEFSEISPSRVDDKVGKIMWASDSEEKPGRFRPRAITKGNITHPDPDNPEVEQLSLFVFMEKFLNGAHPYLKITIRSDRPEEMGLQMFHHDDSAKMERCALTATMGNYSRVRLLHLKNKVVDSRELYEGYDDIHFAEDVEYPAEQLLRDQNGDFIAIAFSNESFSELSSWPQEPEYFDNSSWRYQPFYKVTQYWRKENSDYDSSLRVRVNGRAKYWSGGSNSENDYVNIPGGISFENFEMREKYYPGQKFYFGITKKSPEQMEVDLPKNNIGKQNN